MSLVLTRFFTRTGFARKRSRGNPTALLRVTLDGKRDANELHTESDRD
jgi:hypothetical protein